jgi:hypothetical protein
MPQEAHTSAASFNSCSSRSDLALMITNIYKQ